MQSGIHQPPHTHTHAGTCMQRELQAELDMARHVAAEASQNLEEARKTAEEAASHVEALEADLASE